MSATLVSDEELIAQVRAGETAAYGQLFARHHKVAKKVAVTQLARRSNADDVVSDSFARVLTAIQAGKGPNVAFRPYLLTTVRRACIDHGRAGQRETPVDSFPDDELQFDPTDETNAELERSLAARAYKDLPERWRAVLWYSEIEQLKPAKFAPMLGLTPNAAAALAVRAREGLRDAYVQAHLERESDPLCQPTVEKLGQYLRGSLSIRETAHVDEHLDSCGRCSALYSELQDSAGGLMAVIGVLILGGAAAKWLQRGTAVTWIKSAGPRAQAAVAGATAAAVVAGAVFVASSDEANLARRREDPQRGEVPAVGAPASSGTVAVRRGDAPRTTAAVSTTTARAGDRPITPTSLGGSTSTTPTETTVAQQNSTTTTAFVVPPSVDSDLGVQVESLGDLVRGRPGMFAVNVMAKGAASANSVRLDITLRSGGVSISGTDAPGWSCSWQGLRASCDRSQLLARTASAIFVHLTAPPQASGVGIDVQVATTTTDLNSGDNEAVRTMPVWRTGLAPRFVTRDTGEIVTVGNSVLTCDINQSGCSAAQQLNGPSSGLANDAWNMVPVDSDADSATENSSAASLYLPGGSEVLFAGLYWGGNLLRGNGGRAGDAAAAAEVRFAAAGRSAIGIRASMIEFNAGHYQGFADVTALVASAGNGQYTTGGIAIGTGSGAYGGWSLVVVAQDVGLPMRNLAVYDGMDDVTPRSSAHVMFGAASERGHRAGEMSMVLYDGDNGVTGDSLSFDGVALTDDRNPTNDFANSTIDRGLTRLPALSNGFGLDIDRIGFQTGAAWSPSAAVRASTSLDRFTIGVLTLTLPV